MSETTTRTVQVGIGGPMGPPTAMLTSRPQAAEKAGYASMWWGDHYMGWTPRSLWTPDISAIARPGTSPDTFFDPVAAMALAGSATSEISIGITTESIRRHPVALAQQFLTLQHIAGGRTVLGIGGGEGENLLPYGIPFEKPVGRMEEAIRVIRALWGSQGEPVAFSGEHFRFDDAVFGLPVPEAGLPEIWLCGAGPRMCRVAGELGDGWLPALMTAEDYADRVGRIRKARAAAGREQDPFTFGLFAFAAVAPDVDAAQPLLDHPYVKGMCMTLPASAFERYGVPHPLGESAVGITEYIPGRFGRDEILSMINSIPGELVRDYVPHGSPDDITSQLEPYVRAGLEHVVLLNVTPLADLSLARESFALTDAMARGLTYQL
ncbi:LLM class flavin-dependent oxidoreductase [Pseudonocardia endophytica]|uniref:Phthiodiolone/phenolphthiodiolone dimycocerosates ketoreductase n=1 Tax=Pseudonocardia endophytica TaxID=401976 RepID=A0A4R1HNG5_PSEEN|nr:LLM class flavin-dependent oxidoreductase [Pseudonocardia endophytica]TCK21910.1 phthiodiolone/phenolphthiodiolone dimycocerosates ketoreductase [Pseudonocardia endophytica]